MMATAAALFTVVDPEVQEEEARLFSTPVPRGTFSSDILQDTAGDYLPEPEPDPDPDPDPVPEPEPAFALSDPTIGDVDRLWDWIREDGSARVAAFGATSSVELHRSMTELLRHAAEGLAALHSLYWRDTHVGFAALAPILGTQAQIHIYLAPSIRGRGLPLVRRALAAARQRYPTLELVAITEDRRLAHFAQRAGLTRTQYVLTAPEETPHAS